MFFSGSELQQPSPTPLASAPPLLASASVSASGSTEVALVASIFEPVRQGSSLLAPILRLRGSALEERAPALAGWAGEGSGGGGSSADVSLSGNGPDLRWRESAERMFAVNSESMM